MFCFAGEKQKLIKKSAANNLLSINSESDKSERALMMLDYIMNDRDFYDFLDYGIQGEIVDYPNLDKELDYFESISIKDPYANFAFNPSPVEKEIENVIRVNSQYGPPILLGKAGSPKAAVDKYRLELSTAGIESIIEAVKEQLKDF